MPAKQKAPPDGVASEQTLTTSATVKDTSQDRVSRLHSLRKVIFWEDVRSNSSTFLPMDFQWGLELPITQSCLVPPFCPPEFYLILFICGAKSSEWAQDGDSCFLSNETNKNHGENRMIGSTQKRKQQKPRWKQNGLLQAITLTTALPCSQALPLAFPAPHWEYLEF